MVAAAGEDVSLPRRTGGALLAFVAAGLLLGAWVADRTLLVGRVPIDTPVEVLELRAREILQAVRHQGPFVDTACGVTINGELLSWVAQNDPSGDRWVPLESGHLPALRFWYRTSPRDIVPLAPSWNPGIGDPPLVVSGMSALVVDERAARARCLGLPHVPRAT